MRLMALPRLFLVSITITVAAVALGDSYAFNDFITSLGEPQLRQQFENMIKGGYRIEDALADICLISVGDSVTLSQDNNEVQQCYAALHSSLPCSPHKPCCDFGFYKDAYGRKCTYDSLPPRKLLGLIDFSLGTNSLSLEEKDEGESHHAVYIIRSEYSMDFHLQQASLCDVEGIYTPHELREALITVANSDTNTDTTRIVINSQQEVNLNTVRTPTDMTFLRREDLMFLATHFQNTYHQANPFPHVVMDNIFPAPVIHEACEDFFRLPYWDAGESSNDKSNSFLKFRCANEERMNANGTLALLQYMRSYPFVEFLETLTGIPNLLTDPALHGGGMHSILRGGLLRVHTDFNKHKSLKLWRRVNVFVYLNEDWLESYGGSLELWDADVTTCQQKILPVENRLVVFSSSQTSWHGHPSPLTCPEGEQRKSFAMYYYSTQPPPGEHSEDAFVNTRFRDTT